jgi:hypothetical protein
MTALSDAAGNGHDDVVDFLRLGAVAANFESDSTVT